MDDGNGVHGDGVGAMAGGSDRGKLIRAREGEKGEELGEKRELERVYSVSFDRI